MDRLKELIDEVNLNEKDDDLYVSDFQAVSVKIKNIPKTVKIKNKDVKILLSKFSNLFEATVKQDKSFYDKNMKEIHKIFNKYLEK